MNKFDFNYNWKCFKTGETIPVTVTVPHDAMLTDSRSEHSLGDVNTGWYDATDCVYIKEFFAPASWNDQIINLEFEGIYHKASVYVNGSKVVYHEYGYTGFFVDITQLLNFDGNNEIRVEVVNSDQPNSRWYSGTGIYRPVWLYLFPKQHIIPEGIRITTLDYQNPKIKVEVLTTESGNVTVEILENNMVIQRVEGVANREEDSIGDNAEGKFFTEIKLPGVTLWEPEHPFLYTCRIIFGEDEQEEQFGVRLIECTPEKGFCMNGKRVILRGACIHHDNGLLGACAYEFAERRKIRILMENGYNAVRSAHNPCSKSLLKACDELGMLMVDEYVDMWYIHKTKYDYASNVEDNYRKDLQEIVNKDYNHPSVIMYSTGNEVSETAQRRGIKLCGDMTDYLHSLDPTRPVTCGVNIFFNFLSSMGLGVYSDKKAEHVVKKTKKKAVGSEFFNNLAGFLGADFMKRGATLYPCDIKTREAFANMDIAGYNYGIRRYEHDLKKYPKRLILGSETFCADAYQFWKMAEKHKRIVGDFVWTGMDYLGEVGIGAWEYEEYAPRFDKGNGWLAAGSGRLDLTGKPLAEMKYTKVAFGLDKIGIGVVPVKNTSKKHTPSAWKMTNALESWSWHGCNGMPAKVEVYAQAHHISLFVNGECVGTKTPLDDCRVVFHTKYYDGEVRAKAYDESEHLLAETFLKTAGEETILTLCPEQETIDRERELCYVRLKYTDREGTVKPLKRGIINISVKGGELIGFGSACPYYPRGYLLDTADTYYGEAMAVIRPKAAEKIVIEAESKYGRAICEIIVRSLTDHDENVKQKRI